MSDQAITPEEHKHTPSAFAQRVHGWVDKVDEVIDDPGQALHDAKDRVVEKAHDIKEGIKDKAHDIKEGIKDKAFDIKHGIEDKAHDIKEGIKDKAHDIKEGIANKVDDIKEGISDKVDDIKHKAHDIKDHAVEAVHEGIYAIDQKIQDVGEWLGHKKERATNAVEHWGDELKNGFKNLLKGAVHAVADAAIAVHDFVGDRVDDVKRIGKNVDEFFDKVATSIDRGVEGFIAGVKSPWTDVDKKIVAVGKEVNGEVTKTEVKAKAHSVGEVESETEGVKVK